MDKFQIEQMAEQLKKYKQMLKRGDHLQAEKLYDNCNKRWGRNWRRLVEENK